MADHIVTSYDQELKILMTKIAEMGGLAEGLVGDAVTALTRMDVMLAQKVVLTDARLDRLQHEVEEKAILLIARRQPLAVDLREIMAALRISNDLERVGDLAKNIAKRVTAMNGNYVAKQLVIGVEHLSEIALEQLKDVLDAFTMRDDSAALAVRRRDDEICCSAPRTSSGSAITLPISPKPCISSSPASRSPKSARRATSPRR
jgi:phosphate transport system protein